jgi:hypothetical protein
MREQWQLPEQAPTGALARGRDVKQQASARGDVVVLGRLFMLRKRLCCQRGIPCEWHSTTAHDARPQQFGNACAQDLIAGPGARWS